MNIYHLRVIRPTGDLQIEVIASGFALKEGMIYFLGQHPGGSAFTPLPFIAAYPISITCIEKVSDAPHYK